MITSRKPINLEESDKMKQITLVIAVAVLSSVEHGVLCQQLELWTIKDAKQELATLRRELQATRKDIETFSRRIVPVGSVYIEYHNQPAPNTLWRSFIWRDITNEYAGLFFRAYGGNSQRWGATQSECAPRISEVRYTDRRENGEYIRNLTIPAGGWSEFGYVGFANFVNSPVREQWWEGMKYYTRGCEVRPRNQAIKMWKRIA